MNVYVVWVSNLERLVTSEHRLWIRADFGYQAQHWAEWRGWHVMSVDVADHIPPCATIHTLLE